MTAVWRLPLLGWVVCLALVLWVFQDTSLAMVQIWDRSETYAHAFVVPPIALWLMWRLRGSLAALQPRPSWAALLAVLVLVLGWELGELAQVNALQHFVLVGLVVSTVPLVWGWAVARALAFPLGFLFFAVPFGEFLTPALVQHTADFTVAAVRLSGVPVFREGNEFVIPTGRWSVVEACSGIRYLMASLMVGTLFAHLNYRSLRRRLVFVGVAIVVPIVANWLRAYMIVMIGHLSNNTLATGVDHLVYGWVFFGFVIVAMFMVGARWADSEPPASASAQAVAQVLAVNPGALAATLLALAATLLWMPPALRSWTSAAPALAAAARAPVWPSEWAAGWTAVPNDDTPPLRPSYPGAALNLQQAYGAGDERVWLAVAHFPVQDEARRLVSSTNAVVVSMDPVWNLLSERHQAVPAVPGLAGVRRFELMQRGLGGVGGRGRWVAWQFYWVGGQASGSDARAKLMQVAQQLRGGGAAGSSVVIYTQDDGPGVGDQRLQRFLAANFTPLGAWLARLDHAGATPARHNID